MRPPPAKHVEHCRKCHHCGQPSTEKKGVRVYCAACRQQWCHMCRAPHPDLKVPRKRCPRCKEANKAINRATKASTHLGPPASKVTAYQRSLAGPLLAWVVDGVPVVAFHVLTADALAAVAVEKWPGERAALWLEEPALVLWVPATSDRSEVAEWLVWQKEWLWRVVCDLSGVE